MPPAKMAAGMMNICSTCQGAQSECQERLDANSDYRGMVNETLASRVWPGQSPIGRRVRIGYGAFGFFQLFARRRLTRGQGPHPIELLGREPQMIFGLGEAPKYAVIAIVVFFLVFFNTMSGARYAPKVYFDVGHNLGMSRLNLFRFIALPAATDQRFEIALDIHPTIARAAGAETAANLDGVDLVPYLTGGSKGQPHDKLYWRFGEERALRMGDWKLINQGNGAELYNLAEDTGEKNNLAAAQPGKLKELQAAYDAWNGQLAEPKWNTTRRGRRRRRAL